MVVDVWTDCSSRGPCRVGASPGIIYSARLSNMSMHSVLDGVMLPWRLWGRGMQQEDFFLLRTYGGFGCRNRAQSLSRPDTIYLLGAAPLASSSSS